MLFTLLSIFWILLFCIIIYETLIIKKPNTVFEKYIKVSNIASFLLGLLMALYIWNTLTNINIQNIATLLILIIIAIITVYFLPKHVKTKNTKVLKVLVVTRNVLAFISAIVIFVHFVIFNVFLNYS